MEVYQFTYDYISAIFGNNIDWKKKKKNQSTGMVW